MQMHLIPGLLTLAPVRASTVPACRALITGQLPGLVQLLITPALPVGLL